MMNDYDSSSSPVSYSDMYNEDEYGMSPNGDENTTSAATTPKAVDFGFDDEDALDFGSTYSVPYMQDHLSVANNSTGQYSSSGASAPSDQGRRPSSLLGGGDDGSVVSSSPSMDSYGFSAVGSVTGNVPTTIAPPPMQTNANPTPYHNTAPSVTGSMSSNPYYSYDSQSEDDASVEMSLVTPEPSTPGKKNPFGKTRKDESLLQDVKIQYVPAPQPPALSKINRQASATSYPDHPEDEFGVSVVSSLHTTDDLNAQGNKKKAPYVPSPFAEVPQDESQPHHHHHMAPTSPLTPVFPNYQQKSLPNNVPMAPQPQQKMMDPSIPRPDSDEESGVQVSHHSQYPSQPFGNNAAAGAAGAATGVYASSISSASDGHSDSLYHDEFLERNHKQPGEPMSVSSSVATEKPTNQSTSRNNPFANDSSSIDKEDPESAINLKDPPKENKKKMSRCRKCLCIFIPLLLLILGGGGYYAYTKDFYGFDFFGLYESKETTDGAQVNHNPENPQDKPATDPGINFPDSPSPTAAPAATPPRGVINVDGGNTNSTNGDIGGNNTDPTTGDDDNMGTNNNNNNNNSTNTNSTAGDPVNGNFETKQPHLTPVDTKAPTLSPSTLPTATPTVMAEATATPTTKVESEVILQYRTTIQSFLETQGVSFDSTSFTMTVNALDRLMNDVVVAKFREEEAPTDPFYADIYRVTQRFALYCLGVALEEPAQEDYVKVLEIGQPWTPRSEPTPMYQLVFERLNAGETKSSDHCDWPGVICSTGENRDIISIAWNQQGLDGTIPSEISLLKALTSIDLGNNYIHSTVPSKLYEIPTLEKLVLNHNYLEGQLPAQPGSRLTHLDLGHNLLAGDLESLQAAQGLEYLDLNQNTFTGSIPETLVLPNIAYFDLGHNLLTGPLPTALPKSAVQLRHIHLEHNGFSGNLPVEYLWAGKFQLLTLRVNNNQLTGAVPSGGSDTLVQFTMQYNEFSEALAQETCELDQTLGLGGSVIEFEADCSICQCTGGIFCSSCNA